MADKRAYFKVDIGYFDNPKLANLVDDNPRAVLLHLRAIAYCAQHLTDGVFPMRLVMRLACGSHSDLQCLIDNGLIEAVDDTSGLVHDYLEHQRSAASVKKAKVAGQAAAAARWADGDNAEPNANRIAKRNGSPTAEPNTERERERDRERAPRKRAAHPLPETWKPNAKHAEQALAKGLDVHSLATRFRNWAEASDKRYVNWDATFRNWIDREDPRPAQQPPTKSLWDLP